MGGKGSKILRTWSERDVQQYSHLKLVYVRHIKSPKGGGHHGGVLCCFEGGKWATLDFNGGRGDDGPLNFSGFLNSEERALSKEDDWQHHGRALYPGVYTTAGHVHRYLLTNWEGMRYSFGHIKPFDKRSNCFGFRDVFCKWVQSDKTRFDTFKVGNRVSATRKNKRVQYGALGRITELYESETKDPCVMIQWDKFDENGHFLSRGDFVVIPDIGDRISGAEYAGQVTEFYMSSSGDPCMMVSLDGGGSTGFFRASWNDYFMMNWGPITK